MVDFEGYRTAECRRPGMSQKEDTNDYDSKDFRSTFPTRIFRLTFNYSTFVSSTNMRRDFTLSIFKMTTKTTLS